MRTVIVEFCLSEHPRLPKMSQERAEALVRDLLDEAGYGGDKRQARHTFAVVKPKRDMIPIMRCDRGARSRTSC